jgi:uncharacterized delta-60 repeat protein
MVILVLLVLLFIAALASSGIGIAKASTGRKSGAETVRTGYASVPSGLATTPTGQIVIGATAENPSQKDTKRDFLITELKANGKVVSSFRRNKHAGVRTDLGGADVAEDLAVQSDGKIVQVGCSEVEHGSFLAVVRYLPTGQLDPGFGNNGKVLTPVPSLSCAHSVALQADGKIIIGGDYFHPVMDGGTEALFVRYLPNGQPDPSFGDHGLRKFPLEGYDSTIADLAIDPQGKIVSVGESSEYGTGAVHGVILRMQPNGEWDESFGTSFGLLEISGPDNYLSTVNLSGSSIVATGSTGSFPGITQVVYVSSTGAVNKRTLPLLGGAERSKAFKRQIRRLPKRGQQLIRDHLRFGNTAVGAALQQDGQLVLAASESYAALGLTPSGAINKGFGGRKYGPGLAYFFPIPLSNLSFGTIHDVAVDHSGRILAVGSSGEHDLGVVCWKANGRLDRSFGQKSRPKL